MGKQSVSSPRLAAWDQVSLTSRQYTRWPGPVLQASLQRAGAAYEGMASSR